MSASEWVLIGMACFTVLVWLWAAIPWVLLKLLERHIQRLQRRLHGEA